MEKQEHYAVYEGITPSGDVVVVVYTTPNESGGVVQTSGYHVPVHLVPAQQDRVDGVLHETSEDCPCVPRIGMERDEASGNTYWVIRHGAARDSTYPVVSVL